ncbi:hypothetical protein QHF89_49690 [Polyangium sorediatum]|uniref:Uncharacterized protein n=1 Tax=Polyangium sorediatum TaxID=889274 RepID=A0ABT6PAM0_9BACT|nr:hypothetical protein [Polyangium sorediatum]
MRARAVVLDGAALATCTATNGAALRVSSPKIQGKSPNLETRRRSVRIPPIVTARYAPS